MSTTPAPLSDDSLGRPLPELPAAPRPLGTDVPPPPPGAPRRSNRRLAPALILIVLGALLLLINFIPFNFGDGLLFFGLGLTFLLARGFTGRYGFAVPAGILLGFGSYVTLEHNHFLPSIDRGGWFFILLGLGFLGVYLIGLRPNAIWPIFPAAVMIGFGTLIQGLLDPTALAPLAPIVTFWPLCLVLIGVWLLTRDRLPTELRRPLALIGVLLLTTYAVLAIVTSIAMSSSFSGSRFLVNLPSFNNRGATVSQTVNVSAPIGTGEVLRVTNPSGRTVVRNGGAGMVQVSAQIHSWPGAPQPEVKLTPGSGTVSLELSDPNTGWFNSAWVDYVIELPADAPINLTSASGDFEIADRSGSVQVISASGDVTATRLTGATALRTISGNIRVTDATGELRLNSTSGDIRATGLTQLREATTVSGDVSLTGRLTDAARLASTSGDIDLRLVAGSAFRLDAASTSGDIRLRNLNLTDQQVSAHKATGTFANGTHTVTMSTISGDISVTSQ